VVRFRQGLMGAGEGVGRYGEERADQGGGNEREDIAKGQHGGEKYDPVSVFGSYLSVTRVLHFFSSFLSNTKLKSLRVL